MILHASPETLKSTLEKDNGGEVFQLSFALPLAFRSCSQRHNLILYSGTTLQEWL